jgi:hypothetical protein
VRGVGDELPHPLLAGVPRVEGGLHVGEQRVERRTHLADLGALVGEPLGHPLGDADLAGVQGQRGHPVRGPGHLAQRPQLAPHERQAGDRRHRHAEHDEAALEQQQRADGVGDVAVGQRDHDRVAAVAIDPQRAVGAETGQLDVVGTAVVLDVGEHVEDLVVDRRLGVEPAAAVEHPPRRLAAGPEQRGDQAVLPDQRAVAVGRPPGVGTPGGRSELREAGGVGDVAVEPLGEVGAHREGGDGTDEQRDHQHQADGGDDQPRGEGGEPAPHAQTAGLST